jgi:hypothetical protein
LRRRILLDFASILPKISIGADARAILLERHHEKNILRIMKNTVIVVTDLGSFKAYKLDQTPVKKTPRLELIEEFVTVDAHGKMSDKLTDMAGRHRSGTSKMSTPWGDRHNIELETKRRLIKQLADRVNKLLRNDEIDECHLAASKEISHQLLDELDRPVRAKIAKKVQADLTKIDKSELLAHF